MQFLINIDNRYKTKFDLIYFQIAIKIIEFKLSVLIPSRNGEQYIENCLK